MGKGSYSGGNGGVKGGHATILPTTQNLHTRRLAVENTEDWPKGFTNVGNSCYANATLQCLLSTALTNALLDPQTVHLFRRYSSNANILEMGSGSVDSEDDITGRARTKKETRLERERRERERRKMHETCQWLTKELTSITEDYTSHPSTANTPSSSMMGWLSPTKHVDVVNPGNITLHPDRLSKCLTPYQQEDAHEFLRALLTSLIMDGQNKQLSSLFDGLLESAVTCQFCGRASLTRDRYMDLSLDINDPSVDTLDDALAHYTKTEMLNEENMVFCQKCETKRNATKGLRLATAPSILVCHLKRFAFDCYGQLVRLHKRIDFPLRLEIVDFMSQLNKARPPPYDLVGVLVHQGQTCASGHYLAYVKKHGQWFKCNDSMVTKVDLATVKSQQAYILMYEVAGMRERTCYGQQRTSAIPRTLSRTLSREDLSVESTQSTQIPSPPPRPDDFANSPMMQLLAAAENLNLFLSDFCCDQRNSVDDEPKTRQVKRKRRKKKPCDSSDVSTLDGESTVATADTAETNRSTLMRRRNSSDNLSSMPRDNPDTGRSKNRSQTAPRQRRRTYSYSSSDPGVTCIEEPSPPMATPPRLPSSTRNCDDCHYTSKSHRNIPTPSPFIKKPEYIRGNSTTQLPPRPTASHKRATSLAGITPGKTPV